jgi:HK97 family phage portal protein
MLAFPTAAGEVQVVRPEGESRALTRANVPVAFLGGAEAGEPSATSPRAAMRLSVVFACVRALVHAAVPMPLKTYRPGAERAEADTSLLARLLERPAPGSTTPALVGSILTSLLLTGDAFIGVYLGLDGQPAQLGLLDPSAVEVRQSGDKVTYVWMSPQGVSALDQRDVIHVRSAISMPGSLRGCSPVAWLAASLGENRALSTSAVEFAARAPRPGLLVTMEKDARPTQPEREGLRDEIHSRYGAEAGGVMLLGGGVTDVLPLSLDSASSEFVKHREVAAVEIARAYGVPAALLDLPGGASLTYSNSESRSLDLLRYSLEAHLVSIERAISGHPIARGVVAKFDRRALLRPDSKTRAEVYALGLDPERGWLTRAEVRAAEDMPPEPPAPRQDIGV